MPEPIGGAGDKGIALDYEPRDRSSTLRRSTLVQKNKRKKIDTVYGRHIMKVRFVIEQSNILNKG